jgi:uncharacterized membrane protein
MVAGAKRVPGWIAQHQILCLILFSSFVARLFVSDRSYWYDEILSVAIYGSNHESLASAMRSLAAQSAHPPLYHVVLYYWMGAFTTDEVATRTLSNLYLAGATLCLYLLAFRLFGRRVAILSSLLFAFSYTATYFGTEVRSYAQSLFLVTLSSLLLWRWLKRDESRLTRFTGPSLALILCNIGLLLTHYANALFVITQALFSCLVVLRRRVGARVRALTGLAAYYLLQFAVAAAIWGPVALSTHKRFAAQERFAVHGLPSLTPPEMVYQSVAEPNLRLPLVIVLVLFVLLAIVLVRRTRQQFLNVDGMAPLNAFFLWYLVAWAFLPCLLAYLVFLAAGSERYVPRYLAICVPPFSILLALALEQVIGLLVLIWPRRRVPIERHYLRNATLYALLACAVLVLPAAYRTAKDAKGLYRDIARSIVMLTERDSLSRFAIYEAALRPQSLLDYYLLRISKGKLRVDGTLPLFNETRGRDPLQRLGPKAAESDFLIVVFPYVSARTFPILLPLVQSRYDFAFSQMDRTGRGYVVFRTKPTSQ